MKKLITILLLLTMCAAAIPPLAMAADEPEVIELKFWISKELNVYNSYIDQFNADHPNIHVTFEEYPDHTTLMQKIQVIAGSDSVELPNMIQIDCCMVSTVDSISPLLDLAPYFAKDASFDLTDFYPIFQQEAHLGERIVSLHVAANCDLLFYNKALFRQAGLDPEMPPATWAQVIAYGQKIKENCPADIVPFAYSGILGSYYEFLSWEWQAMTLSAGGSIFNDDYTQPAFNSEAGVQALAFLADVINEQKISTLSAPEMAYENGKLAMNMNGSWNITNYLSYLGEDLGCGLLPGRDQSRVMVGGQSNMLVDSGDPAINEAAWELLKYMMSEPVIIAHCARRGEQTCQQSVAASPAYQELLKDNIPRQVAQEAMENAAFRAPVLWYNEFSETVRACCEPCLYGEISAQDAIAELERATQDIIRRYS